MLYLAHMIFMGDHDGKPLVYGYFEAWEYGPVHPDLYHYVKDFGASPIINDFGHFDHIDDLPKGPERKMLDEAVKAFPPSSKLGPKLISITHWEKGAWHNLYKPNRKGIVIPDEAILEEYKNRSN